MHISDSWEYGKIYNGEYSDVYENDVIQLYALKNEKGIKLLSFKDEYGNELSSILSEDGGGSMQTSEISAPARTKSISWHIVVKWHTEGDIPTIFIPHINVIKKSSENRRHIENISDNVIGSRNNLKTENRENVVSAINELQDSKIEYNDLSTEIPKEIEYAQKIISKDGSLVQWGVSSVTSFIEITDFVKVTGIVGVPAHFYAVAFYSKSKELVSDYNNYLYNFGGGVREIGDIFVLGKEFPKAKYIRISGILTDVKIFKSIKLDIEKLKADVYDKKNSYDIVIIGDSIAQNISSAFLRKMKSVGQHNVKSYAIGGESCLDTIAHRNIYPYTILPPFTIPANGASAALNVISSRWLGVKIAEDAISKTYFNQYSQGTNGEEAGSYIYGTGINPWDKKYCTIGGIHGYLQFNTSGSDRNTNVKFYRDTAGEAITFTHPQTIHEDDPIDSNSIIIVFMGTNGGWIPRDTRASFEDSFAHLIEYYQGIADKYGIENCLFLGFYTTAYLLQAVDKDVIARFKYMEAEFAKRFGTHYWSCYQYLRNYGLEDCGYAATEKDIRDVVQKGLTPCSVRGGTDDGVHLTSNASEAVANGVIRKLYQLGMIDECPQIAIDKTLKILTGTVKTTSNVGVNGIKLTFTNSSDSNKVFSVTTNDDGSYSLGISSGTYNITADSGTLNTTEITIGGNVFNEANFIKS